MRQLRLRERGCLLWCLQASMHSSGASPFCARRGEMTENNLIDAFVVTMLFQVLEMPQNNNLRKTTPETLPLLVRLHQNVFRRR